MPLAPFYTLQGTIDVVRRVELADGRTESTYEDETGRRAVVIGEAVFPNPEPLTVGDYVETVHPVNVGRYPAGLVIGTDTVAGGSATVAIGRGSTVYGPARNWRPVARKPEWLEELEREEKAA